jgi:hypothetical protein
MKLTRKYNYESDFLAEAARLRLQEYFRLMKNDNSRRSRFGGLFISDTEFEVRSRRQMMSTKNPAYITGQLLPGNDKLRVNLIFRYTEGFKIAFFALVIAIIPLFFFFGGSSPSGPDTAFIIFLFLIGLLGLGLTIFLTFRSFKKTFESLLNLRSLADSTSA